MEHKALTVPHHPRLLFQFLGSIRHLVGFLGWGISPVQGLYPHRTTQHRKTQTNIHALSRIRTCDPNVWAAEDSTCPRPLSHWDQQKYLLPLNKYCYFLMGPVTSSREMEAKKKKFIEYFISTWHASLFENRQRRAMKNSNIGGISLQVEL
jgi:hypothetical protein